MTVSSADALAPPPGGPVAIRVEACVDRTRTPDRDLAAEVSKAFADDLRKSQAFAVEPSGRYALSCEVRQFMAGSAVARWIAPGLGPTVGEVAAMISDTQTGQTVLIVRGNATVSSGGLYT